MPIADPLHAVCAPTGIPGCVPVRAGSDRAGRAA